MTETPFVPSYEESAVVIAGGTAGIGLASAMALAEKGVRRFALLGRDKERGAAGRQTLLSRHPGVEATFIRCDAADVDSVTGAVDQAHRELGGLDVLINSVGSKYKPEIFWNIEIEDVGDWLTSQALPPMLLTRAAMPYLKAQGGGSIVNIASDAAKIATPGEVMIGASMAAIVMFTRACAIELKRDGIRVNAVTPSLVLETEGTEWIMSGGFSKKLFEAAAKQAHLGVPVADDVARMVAFLCGPDAARLTGQAISVNGGISAA